MFHKPNSRSPVPFALVPGALVLAALATGCGGPSTTERLDLDPLQTIDVPLDLDRYDGLWFEIARFENTFQEGCTATTAEYTQQDDGQIGVLNRCNLDSPSGDPIEASGVARAVDLGAGKLEVSFFGPFFADYWVVELGDSVQLGDVQLGDDEEGDYAYAVVSEPGRDTLWILSRETTLPDATLDGILERLEAQQLDTDALIWTEHED